MHLVATLGAPELETSPERHLRRAEGFEGGKGSDVLSSQLTDSGLKYNWYPDRTSHPLRLAGRSIAFPFASS